MKAIKEKYIWQLIGFIILTLFMISCSYSHLHYSKNYRIRSLEADTASFRFVDGYYLMDTKGLKIGQKIWLQRTKDSTKANVKRIK